MYYLKFLLILSFLLGTFSSYQFFIKRIVNVSSKNTKKVENKLKQSLVHRKNSKRFQIDYH